MSKMSQELERRLDENKYGLYEGCRLGLRIAEEYIHDEYDGTSMLVGLLEELEPIRRVLAKIEGKNG